MTSATPTISATRTEQDLIGDLDVPLDCLYGVQTARAVENFPISGVHLGQFPELVRGLALVKKAAARANGELGVLPNAIVEIIVSACDEILAGRHHESFVVDMIQGGAGTSTNMNANEVIANVGLALLGHMPGEYQHLHPNDHVNRSQSTNDAYPTAIRLALLAQSEPLIKAVERLSESFFERASAFDGIGKVGRTQLQDAVPMTLGMEFASFGVVIEDDTRHLVQVCESLKEINLGGTAIGTGIAAPKGYGTSVTAHLSAISGYDLSHARDLVAASSDMGALVTYSGALKRIAVKVSKICNDLRLLASGPRAGFGEIILPAMQPGSSIMPGKVNPVIPEVVNQVAFQISGHDLAVTMAAEAGQLQLNAMEPLIAFNLFQSVKILTNALDVLRERCVVGIEANKGVCEDMLGRSLALATALVPHVGYAKAVQIAVSAQNNRTTLEEAAEKLGWLSKGEFDAIVAKAW